MSGSKGRIAVYRVQQASTIISDPINYLGFVGEIDPTPTPYVPTPINLTPTPGWGTAKDGNLTVATTFNISTQNSNGRECYTGGDGVSYQVLQLTGSWAKLGSTPTDECLQTGDEILLINMRGTTSNHGNAGNYEFLKVGGVVGDMVYFNTAKTKYYGDNVDDDSNIGSATGNQLVAIYRVPHYDNVTLDGTLTTNAWTGKDGLIVFRVAGTLTSTGAGVIDLNGKGYRGGAGHNNGEGPAGSDVAVGSGGGAGTLGSGNGCPKGGGAGYLTKGGQGSGGRDGVGGEAFGDPRLDQITFGPGGGGGGEMTLQDGSRESCDTGGRGGGALFVIGNTLTLSEITINANGFSSGDGGGGAGGTVRLQGNKVTLGSVSLSPGGSGRYGRMAVYYQSDQSGFTGSYSPLYLQRENTPDTLFISDFETGILTPAPQWDASVGNLSASTSANYWEDFGLQVPVDDNNSAYVENNLPQSEPEYRARIYLDPNSLTMAASDVLDLFTGSNNDVDVLHVQMRKAPLPVRDQGDALFQYSGNWATVTRDGTFGGSYKQSAGSGDTVTFDFTGDQFNFLYSTGAYGGILDIYVDDIKIGSVNQSGGSTHQNVWISPLLEKQQHTVRLVHVSGSFVWFDAAQLYDAYQVRAGLLDDAGAWSDTGWYDIPDAWSAIELEYGAFANSGSLTLWLNGVQTQTLTTIDNETRTITEVRLGVQGIEADTRGTLYFDDFESRRFSYIGTLPDPGVEDIQATSQAGWQATTYEYTGTEIDGLLYKQPHAVTD
ncbi:MAG: hypothetical protein WCC12_14385, partial [Anaerolineales bacterium]